MEIKKPLLLDLSHGRIGTFIKTEPAGDIWMNVEYIPLSDSLLNFFPKTEIIRKVPNDALVPIPREGYMTSDMYVLIAGENGESPLLNKLGKKWNEMLVEFEKQQEVTKTEKKAIETQQRLLSRGGTEGMQEFLDQFAEIQKKVTGQQFKKRLGHPFEEEK